MCSVLSNFSRRPYFSIQEAGLDGCHVHFPGRIPDDGKSELIRLLLPVAASAFGQQSGVSFENDVYQHVFESEDLVIAMGDCGYPVAFSVWKTFRHEGLGSVLYLSGICVSSTHQRMGIGKALLRYMIQQTSSSGEAWHVAMRTQNPVMKVTFDKNIGKSYPDGRMIPNSIKRISRFVAECLGDVGHDVEMMISRGVYGRSLYSGDIPRLEGEDYNVGVFGELDPDRGDALICVAEMF